MDIPPEARARQIATLEAFVMRARRVAEHSLVQDKQLVDEIVAVTFQVLVTPTTGKATMKQSLPSEEGVESLAARVRPMILEGDPVAHGKVTSALKSLLQDCGDAGLLAAVESMRKYWQEVLPTKNGLVAYSVQTWQAGGEDEASHLSDSELALGWFYGDVVHADPKRRATTDVFGIRERYRAAVPLVFRIAKRTIITLSMIQYAQSKGYFNLSPSSWDADVVVGETDFEEVMKILVAEGSTPMPEAGEEYGPEWKSIVDMPEIYRRTEGEPV